MLKNHEDVVEPITEKMKLQYGNTLDIIDDFKYLEKSLYECDNNINITWMAVLFPTKVADIFSPLGGMSQTAVFTLLGIHSTK